ncbi:Oidioi.mRNA.OKI2018_I69.chr1.g1806.t1.cds [Oikopleura dioica]|uniref:Oidioi.mRNA.OKI2018_I69.chr1.g1806.t1.cds n=1 Tax=Oikopleura dioica TaxID=34765 RepID=A0ABN7SU34_OIKDI|nr:Oidioi.mRNA.OKI2018_I69.chr1.g1806.t1.cds [Oikopleura dioica]
MASLSVEDETYFANFKHHLRKELNLYELLKEAREKGFDESEQVGGKIAVLREEIAKRKKTIEMIEIADSIAKEEQELITNRNKIHAENADVTKRTFTVYESSVTNYNGLFQKYEEAIKQLEKEIEGYETEIASLKNELSLLKNPKNLFALACQELQPSCGICFEKYDEEKHKKAVITKCGHTFGRPCLMKLKEIYVGNGRYSKNAPNAKKTSPPIRLSIFLTNFV